MKPALPSNRNSVIPLFGEDEFPVIYLTRVYYGLGANGQIKIGLTKRQNGRRGGEMHFTELCSVPGGRDREDEEHAKYAEERYGASEWFELSDRLLMDLLTLCIKQERHKSVEILKEILYERLRRRIDAA